MASKRPPQSRNEQGPGRTARGTFAPGHSGNPAGRVRVLSELEDQIRDAEFEEVPRVLAAMRNRALRGDSAAARVYLDRVMGIARPADFEERLNKELEKRLKALIAAAEEGERAAQIGGDAARALLEPAPPAERTEP